MQFVRKDVFEQLCEEEGRKTWLGNVFKLDFGVSFISQREVVGEIFRADRIGTSFFVAFSFKPFARAVRI